MTRFALHSQRVVLPEGSCPATVFVDDGIISKVVRGSFEQTGYTRIDFGNDVIMPGLIDSHVHINEPGRTHWEGFETATKAAAAGGISTLIDMPLNSTPVTTSADAFRLKLEAAKNNCFVNCGFWGGVIPDNVETLEKVLEGGVFGIKAFLTHSGIDDFPNVTEADLIKAMPALQKYDRPLLVHCELDSPHIGQEELRRDPENYLAYLASRTRSWEDEAIALMIDLCERYEVRTHIVHLSSSDSIPQIKVARDKGLRLTVETCPHYLYFNAEQIENGNTLFKCAPPIRESENNIKLWEAINTGLIDFIVTDHSPAPPEMKEIESGNFQKAWGGIAGLQFSLPVVWTSGRQMGLDINRLNELMSSRIAEFLGLETSKGKIAEGFDADITIWNPEEKFIVTEESILFRHAISPYVGEELYGVVRACMVGGEWVFDGDLHGGPKGNILLKNN